MDRRWAGIGVLVVGLLLAAILPKLDGRGIAGTAERADIPVPGDCLLVTGMLDEILYGSGSDTPRELPIGTLGSCTAVDAGQVFSVDHQHRPAGPLDPRAYGELYSTVCGPGLADYVRAMETKEQFVWQGDNSQIGYRPRSDIIQGVIVGSAAGAGQPWSACILAVSSSPGGGPLSLASSRAAERLSSCWFDERPFACDQPHDSEVLGSPYMISNAPARSDFERACHAFVVHRIGTDGPVTSGQLRIEVDDGGNWAGGDCRVTVVDPARTLSGTMVGIGDSPLPWTP